MSDVLCIYYSRTGKTKQAMEEIARALDAKTVVLRDGTPRRGALGWLRCGLDAMRRTTRPVLPFQTARPLSDYRLVVVGSPIWAGRCSSVTRSFLKQYGAELKAAAYVVTRSSEKKSKEVFEQMDLYVLCGHQAAVSLRSGSVGYAFWQEEFLRQVREFLAQQPTGVKEEQTRRAEEEPGEEKKTGRDLAEHPEGAPKKAAGKGKNRPQKQ